MGRRKIEIKAIKDDRNRSVTFLKRKGGLFKKAHELSVLCSVDVAVIIFGNNKKLYEYSSSDIGEILTRYQYYGGANEHKGPADFTGKGKDMDDDDDDDGSGPSHHGSEPPQMMPPHPYPNQSFHQMRQATPSASPPIPNGVFPIHPQQQRQHTPQPQQGSRPSSRNGNLPRRQSSNLVPAQHQHPQHNGFAYHPQPAIYNPQNTPPLPSHHGLPQHMQQGQPMQGPPQVMQQPGPPPQYPNYGPPPQHQQQPPPNQQQLQQMYIDEQRRASVPPPNYPPQDQQRPPSRPSVSPPQPQPQQIPQHPPPPPQIQAPPPQEEERHQEQQPRPPPQHQMLEPVKRMSVKSRSIFTPIDESRSILSQHWASSTSNAEPLRSPPLPLSNTRSQSMDVGAVARVKISNSPPPPVRANTHTKNRVSVNSVDSFTPPSRTNSAQMGSMKRPVLKVHIPDVDSEAEQNTADSNSDPRSSADANGSNPQQNSRSDSHSGVVLPPPSPSASALLSAGASGPPNPFARPHHPVSQPSQNSNTSNNMIDTPVSALPSRFMNNSDFLPSPSSFYPEWAFGGRNDSNTLPSPLNFATPVVGTGPSFLREDSGDRAQGGKRKTPEGDGGSEGSGGGDSKRMKTD
ncbi:SRF-like protein [Glarea lozoyensis ATCC 20868]|uniref:SRF-like protein n=1 Tax=Glarea lozoyensis (strain ATCC 20868 / MF5171) TaxID=1116229 RepID=S3DDJ9_GLAL2|nr:SRF-like protein [Glarea lozoyensis ATCC 20868]EPE24733.1 SRF-like protein [Glarea lozoyensis ATCC 20868]